MRFFLQGYLCIVSTTLILAIIFVEAYSRDEDKSVVETKTEESADSPKTDTSDSKKPGEETDSEEEMVTEADDATEEVDAKGETKPDPEEMANKTTGDEVEEMVEDEPVVEEKAPPPFEIVLPTDNREIFRDPSKFFMHTNRYINGKNIRPWQGGNYGYVRNQLSTGIGVVYTRLHEGIDIKPVARDSRNIPLDDVYSISDGTVVYVNNSSSRSNYGKYAVVRHDWPDGPFYSLYAHLASSVVSSGQEVKAGDTLGRLGYTGAGLDRERAHVHVELAFMMSELFNTRYSPGNGHRNYNGLNLIGMDIARFIREHHVNPYLTMKEFLKGEEPYCKIRTARSRKPGILERHPWLGVNMENEANAKSWEFTIARTGIPLEISPCETSYKYATVTWVKDVKTNHSYMTSGRLLGSRDKAKLSSRGHSYFKLISEAF